MVFVAMLLHDTPIPKVVPAIMLPPSLAAELTVNLVFSCPDLVGGQSTPFDAAIAFGPTEACHADLVVG